MSKSPRLYLSTVDGSGWENVEITAYARWLTDGTLKSYSGLTMVARTNHGDFTRGCSAAGYYARLYRSTGEASFQKEYFHDSGTVGTIYSASKRVAVEG